MSSLISAKKIRKILRVRHVKSFLNINPFLLIFFINKMSNLSVSPQWHVFNFRKYKNNLIKLFFKNFFMFTKPSLLFVNCFFKNNLRLVSGSVEIFTSKQNLLETSNNLVFLGLFVLPYFFFSRQDVFWFSLLDINSFFSKIAFEQKMVYILFCFYFSVILNIFFNFFYCLLNVN